MARLNTRQLSGPRLHKAFRQTCTAVAYIHNMLVAHLDIKPASCFASPLSSSVVKLIDFDSAKELKKADDRYGGNLAGSSWERAHQQPCRALAKDVYMTGLPADRTSGQLRARMRARVMPVLGRAAQRPSMLHILKTGPRKLGQSGGNQNKKSHCRPFVERTGQWRRPRKILSVGSPARQGSPSSVQP